MKYIIALLMACLLSFGLSPTPAHATDSEDDIGYSDDVVDDGSSPAVSTETEEPEVTSPVTGRTAAGVSYRIKHKETCRSNDGGWAHPTHTECMDVTWWDYGSTGDHSGMEIRSIEISCFGGPYEGGMAINGIDLYLKNDNGTKKYDLTDAGSNVSGSCYRKFTVNLNFPTTSYVLAAYIYKPRYDNQPDPGELALAEYLYA